jgi:hypothetical protein
VHVGISRKYAVPTQQQKEIFRNNENYFLFFSFQELIPVLPVAPPAPKSRREMDSMAVPSQKGEKNHF